MALSDAQLFSLWGPRCSGRSAQVSLYGEGKVIVNPAIIDAVRALNDCLVRYRYWTRRADTGAFACRKKVSGNGWSPHAYKIALDLNWTTNPYSKKLITDMPRAMVNEIKAIRTNNGKQVWTWGGDWRSNKDAMHYQIACSPRDLATGIRGRAPGPSPIVPPPYVPPTTEPVPPPEIPIDILEDDEMQLFRDHNGAVWLLGTDGSRKHIASTDEVEALKIGLNPIKYRDLGPGQPFYNPIISQTILNHTFVR